MLDFEDFVETDSAELADFLAIDSAGPGAAALMAESAWLVPHTADCPGCSGWGIEDC